MTIIFYYPTLELFCFSFTQPFTHSKFCLPNPSSVPPPAINNDRFTMTIIPITLTGSYFYQTNCGSVCWIRLLIWAIQNNIFNAFNVNTLIRLKMKRTFLEIALFEILYTWMIRLIDAISGLWTIFFNLLKILPDWSSGHVLESFNLFFCTYLVLLLKRRFSFSVKVMDDK
jgi:hypothetical protein